MARDEVGEHIESLLAELASGVRGVDAATIGERLVATLVDYYGAGLERIVEIIDPAVVHELATDPLVESLLVLHGLHPLTVDERIEAALDRVRPYLGSHAGGVRYLGVDADGIARLELAGNCSGCPSSTVTVRMTIEEAVLSAAPEVSRVEVAGQVEQPKLLQISLRPGATSAAQAKEEPPRMEPTWLHPSALELPAEGALAAVHLDGRQVLMVRLRDTYLAYADACAACGATLTDGVLEREVVACASCGTRFDVRLAGRSLDGSGQHLSPLPLLDDVSGIRVALVPEAVG